MADFLSSTDKKWFADSATAWFDTFKRQITIHKEPIKTIKNNINTQLVGYGQNGQTKSEQIQYTPRNQNFYAVIKYNNNQDLNLISDINAYVTSQNYTSIIVDSNARNYINKDKTEKITFDDKSFNVISKGTTKYYFLIEYYEYVLQEIT